MKKILVSKKRQDPGNKHLLCSFAAGLLLTQTAYAAPLPGGTLDPTTIPKYVTPLVIPPVMDTTGTANDYNIGMRQFKQQILPGGIFNTLTGRNDNYPPTKVWSYGPEDDPVPISTADGGGWNVAPAQNSQFNYPAYTLETVKDTPVTVDWRNQLVRRPDRCRSVGGVIGTEGANDCKFIRHLLPVDQTLHWANPKARCNKNKGQAKTDCRGQSQNPYAGAVPMVPHLHGAHVEGHSDGYPEAWWLPAASNVSCVPRDVNTGLPVRFPGAGEFVCSGSLADEGGNVDTTTGVGHYTYRNDQPSTTLWFHDHSLGITRQTVYAGPAGFWLIRDAAGVNQETGLVRGNLPGPAPVAGESLKTTNFPAALGGERAKYREIPIVIQDRSFNADGSLFYPDNRAFFEELEVEGTNGGSNELQIKFAGNDAQDRESDIAPIWNPEAFFNTMVVNGTTWPQLDVAPSLYRFRLLNGTNSRFLNLSFPVVDANGNQTLVMRSHWYKEVDAVTGQYVPGWLPYQIQVDELFAYQIGTEQALLPKVTAVRAGFASQINVNPRSWAKEILPYLAVNDQLIQGETPASDPVKGLLMGPAERSDIILDFRGLPDGTIVRMINTAPDAPFGGFPDAAADPDTTGQVMQFVVRTALLGTSPTDEDRRPNGSLRNWQTAATSPWDLKLGPVEGNTTTFTSSNTRELALIEEESSLVCADIDLNGNMIQLNETPSAPGVCPTGTAVPFAPKAAVLGTWDTINEPMPTLWADPIVTEPANNSAETWNINNFTEDAHPIHVHLVKFKVNSRSDYTTGGPSTVTAFGPTGDVVANPDGVEAWEHGWKDTVIVYPGEMASVQADFDIAGLYVWHCHILEHEDNEMMVPYCPDGSKSSGGVCPDNLF